MQHITWQHGLPDPDAAAELLVLSCVAQAPDSPRPALVDSVPPSRHPVWKRAISGAMASYSTPETDTHHVPTICDGSNLQSVHHLHDGKPLCCDIDRLFLFLMHSR